MVAVLRERGERERIRDNAHYVKVEAVLRAEKVGYVSACHPGRRVVHGQAVHSMGIGYVVQ